MLEKGVIKNRKSRETEQKQKTTTIKTTKHRKQHEATLTLKNTGGEPRY
jgi:hypothetical protein